MKKLSRIAQKLFLFDNFVKIGMKILSPETL
jgi:hypothetical protein